MQETKTTILLVEDEAEIAGQLQSELEQEGFRVTTAQNGRDALRSLERSPLPDLILLDLLLPIVDGWQFLRARNEHRAWADIPVIAVSAVAYRGAPGAQAVLPKPINLDSLLSTIRGVCSRSAAGTGERRA